MEDKGKETGKGRGAALLKLAKEKRPGDSAVKSSSESPSQTQHNVPLYYPTEMPSSSTTGHGRGSLLSTLRSMQYASASTSKQVEVTSPDRELSVDKSAEYVRQFIDILFSVISLNVFSSFQK
ncbi:uncharacterized protein [Bombus fervidus]|uniref:uncharacterized protein n=1 Tax=Bombus fervidus TaxID=203811 RepID=UPI003D18E0A3